MSTYPAPLKHPKRRPQMVQSVIYPITEGGTSYPVQASPRLTRPTVENDVPYFTAMSA